MKERVRDLRQNMTLAENRMWYYLRSRCFGGYKFIRQQAIDNYIVDFVCREKKLIVEVDGVQHMDATEYDDYRTSVLESRGYRRCHLNCVSSAVENFFGSEYINLRA